VGGVCGLYPGAIVENKTKNLVGSGLSGCQYLYVNLYRSVGIHTAIASQVVPVPVFAAPLALLIATSATTTADEVRWVGGGAGEQEP
jgi:hypothetical protein